MMIIFETADKLAEPMETLLLADLTSKNVWDSKKEDIIRLMKFIPSASLLKLNSEARLDAAKRKITNYARKN